MSLTKDRILYGPHRKRKNGVTYGARKRLRCRLGLHRLKEGWWYSVGDLGPGESVEIRPTPEGPEMDGRILEPRHEMHCEWCFGKWPVEESA